MRFFGKTNFCDYSCKKSDDFEVEDSVKATKSLLSVKMALMLSFVKCVYNLLNYELVSIGQLVVNDPK